MTLELQHYGRQGLVKPYKITGMYHSEKQVRQRTLLSRALKYLAWLNFLTFTGVCAVQPSLWSYKHLIILHAV